MIEARDLRKIYKTKKGVVVNALDGVSIKLPDKGMVFILGKSGSGKSTLLNVLGGLDSIDGGEIIIKGKSAKSFKQSHYDSYRNTYIGFIFQEYNILEELTVGANIALAIELQGRRATNEEINKILEEVDLDGYGARKPNELSGGQKQRVAIARALVKNPEIIMADEPTGALDSNTGKQVFDTLKKLSRDKLVLIVSHDREFSEQYADRIVELKDGAIISDVEKVSDGALEDSGADYEENISYESSTINIKAGYRLTEEDRLKINEYLARLESGVEIKLSDKKERSRRISSSFKQTDESKIELREDENFRLIKSKLSIKNAFKLGSGALKYKKVRLVFTIFLSFIAFTLFGLADTIAAYDNITTATNSIFDTGVPYTSYIKNVKHTYNDGDFYWVNWNTFLTPEDVEKIESETGGELLGIYKKDLALTYSDCLGMVEGGHNSQNISKLYDSQFSGIAEFDSEMMANIGYGFIGNNSRAPSAENEIVITEFIYRHFEARGLLEYTDEGIVETEITSPDDLIGKEISINIDGWGYNPDKGIKYKIVGIIDTLFDYDRYGIIAESGFDALGVLEQMAITQEFESAKALSFLSVCFVHSSVIEEKLEFAKNSGDPLVNSNLLILKTDSDVSYDSLQDYYENSGNLGYNENYYVSRITRLENVRDNVVWIGGEELDSLKDNQIIMSMSNAIGVMRNYEAEKILYSQEFSGFEREFFDKLNSGEWSSSYVYPSILIDFVNSYDYIARFYYARENEDIARAAVREHYSKFCGEDEKMLDDMMNNIHCIYDEYVRCSIESDLGYDKEESKNYLNGFIGRYRLENAFLSDELIEKLNATVTFNGMTYSTFSSGDAFINNFCNNYQFIITRKYAAENFEDAKAFYKALYKAQNKGEEITDEILNVQSPEMIVNMYSEYLSGYRSFSGEIDFAPTSKVDLDDYVSEHVILVYNDFGANGNIKTHLGYESYFNGESKFINNVEIVGFINSLNYMQESVCVSDSLSSKLAGANQGGVFSFAAGKMPESREDIRRIVEFSKTFEEGDIRYQLKNNVSDQLDMVDEILDVLGQVFLYVGLGFALFASLMLSNFIATSISYKKQEIGILRAIGSRSNDVFRIFFAESFIIAMINYVLATAGTLVLTIVINGILRDEAGLLITFLTFGLRQIGILFGVSILVALIATFLPVKKIASMKPIDAIKNRK